MPKVSAEAGSTIHLVAVLLEGREGRKRGAASAGGAWGAGVRTGAGKAWKGREGLEGPGRRGNRLLSIIRKKVFIMG